MKQQTKFKQTEIGEIPEDWDVKKLGDACEKIASGGTPLTNHIEYYNGNIPWLRTQEVNFKRIYQTEKSITKLGLDNSSAKLISENSVIMAMYGATAGKVAINKISLATNQACCNLIINSKLANYEYIYYYLMNNYKWLLGQATGAAQQNLSVGQISNIQISLPPIREQSAIAKILSSLDSKIELNQKINKTLEAIGQALFKRWFIDFEFPNEKGKPYKSLGGEMVESELGEIPKGWKIGKLGDNLDLLKDGSHNPPKRTEKGIKFIAGASDLKHFYINFQNCSFISKEDYELMHRFWKIKPQDVLLTIVGTVGNVAIVRESDLPFSLQRSIAILRAGKKVSYQYLYFLLNSLEFKQFINSRVNTTAQPGIYLGTISKMDLIIPKRETLESFNVITESLIVRMQKNVDEIETLTSLRDSLLPKLMSGKIRVPLKNGI